MPAFSIFYFLYFYSGSLTVKVSWNSQLGYVGRFTRWLRKTIVGGSISWQLDPHWAPWAGGGCRGYNTLLQPTPPPTSSGNFIQIFPSDVSSLFSTGYKNFHPDYIYPGYNQLHPTSSGSLIQIFCLDFSSGYLQIHPNGSILSPI